MQTSNRFTRLSIAGIALPDTAALEEVAGIRINATGIIVAPQLANGGEPLPHRQAIAGVEKFALPCFAGLSWRAPELEEVVLIPDRSRINPALDPAIWGFLIAAYKGGRNWRLWTKTAWAGDPASYAWGVHLHSGYAYIDSLHHQGLVLPVCGPVSLPGQS